MLLVTDCPSRFNWKVTVLPVDDTGTSWTEFNRLPGASIVRSTQLRPLIGSSCIWRGSMLLLSVDWVVSRSGASAVTVTDSWSVAGDICRLIRSEERRVREV